MKSWVIGALLLGGGGEPPGDRPDPVQYDGSAGQVDVATPRIVEADVDIDGRLDEAVWADAALLHSFTQYDPVEGIPAAQRTEARVFVTDDAIYFGIHAFDDVPGGVRATLAERDEFSRSDDYVRVVLDTFNDQRGGYAFTVNPYGIQGDGIWSEGGGGRGRGGGGFFGQPIDDNPDFLFDSDGRITEDGYVVEIRIPFKTLRFRDLPLQAWGLNIYRRTQRNGYQQSWAPVTREETNQLAQAGRLSDLRDLDPGLFLELNPVVTGTRLGTYDEGLEGLDHSTERPEFGLNVTYGLTSNLTLDGTYNPDFSQVEADAGQIAVNERFALFFPEKRPFFLEGTEIFRLQKQLVYTRSVVDPVAGAKITGKMGDFNVGYMGAVDQVPSSASENDAVVNLFRLRRDLGTSSTLGVVYTDRTRSSDVYNRLAGADARIVFARRYTLDLLGAGSSTAVGSGAATSGSLFSARLGRTGRQLSFSAEVEDVHPEFSAGSGFIRRIGDTQLQSRVSYNRYGKPGSLIERYGPSLELRGTWDHDAFWAGEGSLERQVELRTSVSFRNNITVFVTGSRSGFTFPDEDYASLMVETRGGGTEAFQPDQSIFQGLHSLSGWFMVGSWEKVRGNVRFGWSETPLFDRSSGVPVEPADQWGGNVTLNLYPTTSLSGEAGIRTESLYRERDGSRYSTATIPRIRAQYQVSKSLFVRGIFEYAMIEREPLLDPVTGGALQRCGSESCSTIAGSDGYDIHVEALVSYEPSPGTVMYIGYSREMEDTGSFRFRQVRPQADGLFAKVSYRFRY